MKKIYRMIAVVLVVLTVFTNVSAAEYDVDELIKNAAEGLCALGADGKSLLGMGENFPAGTSACDWTAMCMAFTGMDEDYESYLSDLKAYVEENYAKNGILDKVKSTTYHRIALTVTALGGDAADFGVKPDGTPIDLIAEGTYNFGGKNLGAQGLNGYIYALICLDAYDVQIPEGALYTREDIKTAIVSAQNENGGFSLSGANSEVDMTAMALQALAPYKAEYEAEIRKAVDYLASQMSDECLFEAFGDASCESSAQVILALAALGIDPQSDSRFRRGSNDVLTATQRYLCEDGTYSHLTTDESGDYLATTQMLLALISVSKLRNNDGWVFDFTDYEAPEASSLNVPVIIAGTAVVIVVASVILKRKRK